MKIEDLKKNIESGSLTDSPLILVYKNSGRIVCDQYIDEICRIKNMQKQYLSALAPVFEESLFRDDSTIYVVNVDILEDVGYVASNHIVCCHNVSKDIQQKFSNEIVAIPELEDWQFKAYVSGVLPGIGDDRLEWLCSICSDYRLMLEVDKIKLFAKEVQGNVFDSLVEEGNFDDLSNFNIFNLSNAIQKKDPKAVGDVVAEIEAVDVNPIGLCALLFNNFKDITAIKLSPSAMPQTLGINPKKFNALKYCVSSYTKEQLYSILLLLSRVDQKIKSGELTTDMLVDYIITHIFYC